MYRCAICNTVVPSHTPAHRLTVESRTLTYPKREKAHAFRRERQRLHHDDPGGIGTAISREVLACVICARR